MYERLCDWLINHVRDNGIEPGDRLPTERELAKRLGVSRASVSQAMIALEVQGVVVVRHGDGTYLRRTPRDEDAPLPVLLDRRRRLPEVLEARDALETKLAELAATRRTEADLAAIDDALEAMGAAIDRGDIGAEEDERFHAAVTAAAHNAVIGNLMQRLAVPLEELRLESLSQPGRPPLSLASHQRIVAAIRRRDPAGAAAAARAHVALVGDVEMLRSMAGRS